MRLKVPTSLGATRCGVGFLTRNEAVEDHCKRAQRDDKSNKGVFELRGHFKYKTPVWSELRLVVQNKISGTNTRVTFENASQKLARSAVPRSSISRELRCDLTYATIPTDRTTTSETSVKNAVVRIHIRKRLTSFRERKRPLTHDSSAGRVDQKGQARASLFEFAPQ